MSLAHGLSSSPPSPAYSVLFISNLTAHKAKQSHDGRKLTRGDAGEWIHVRFTEVQPLGLERLPGLCRKAVRPDLCELSPTVKFGDEFAVAVFNIKALLSGGHILLKTKMAIWFPSCTHSYLRGQILKYLLGNALKLSSV